MYAFFLPESRQLETQNTRRTTIRIANAIRPDQAQERRHPAGGRPPGRARAAAARRRARLGPGAAGAPRRGPSSVGSSSKKSNSISVVVLGHGPLAGRLRATVAHSSARQGAFARRGVKPLRGMAEASAQRCLARPGPRPLPAAQPLGSGGLGSVWLALRRAARPRGRTQDRRPRRARGPARRARGGRRGAAPPPRLPARVRARPRRRTRLHRLRVRPRPHAARRARARRARRPGRDRGGGPDPRRARPRALARHRPPGREAGERSARRRRRLSVRLLDFGLALIDEEETLTAQATCPERSRTSRRSASPASRRARDGHLVDRRPALGGARRAASVRRGRFLETAKRIGRGAPPLASARPDLPQPLTQLVDPPLSIDPAKRPTAASSPPASAARPSPRPGTPAPPPVGAARPAGRRRRLAPPRPAALLARLGDRDAPFCPRALACSSSPRSRRCSPWSARASGSPSPWRCRSCRSGTSRSGWRALHRVAFAWLALFWPRPASRAALPGRARCSPPSGRSRCSRSSSLPAGRAGAARAQTVAGVLAAAVVAGLAGRGLPLVGGDAPSLALVGASSPLGAPRRSGTACRRRPRLPLETLALAAAAAAVGSCRRRGPWGGAAFGRSCSAPRSSPIRAPRHYRSSPPPGSRAPPRC